MNSLGCVNAGCDCYTIVHTLHEGSGGFKVESVTIITESTGDNDIIAVNEAEAHGYACSVDESIEHDVDPNRRGDIGLTIPRIGG